MDNKTNVSWVQISLLLWLKHHPNFKWKAHKEVWQNSRALQSTAEKDTPANLNGRLNMNESMVAFLSLFIDSLLNIKRTVSNDRNQKIFFLFIDGLFWWRSVSSRDFFRIRSYSSKHKVWFTILWFYDLTIFFWIFLEGKEIAKNTSISTMSCTTHNEYISILMAEAQQILLSTLKVSKFRKQIILSSHIPKNQRNVFTFFALASKKS